MNGFQPVIEALEQLKEDPMTIKRVKEKAEQVRVLLQENSQVNTDKALRELEELGSSEIPAYDRTRLWDVISLLESLKVGAKP